MEGRAELVSHRVADTEEGVCERHTGDCGSVVDFLTSFFIDGSVFVSCGQVLEDQAGGFTGKTVGVFGSEDRNTGFESVNQSVDTGVGGKFLRHVHHQTRVDDRHGRGEFIVRQRILVAGRFVGDDGERCNFGTGSGSGRDCNEGSLRAEFRELVDALADIHEAHCDVVEVDFRVFVEQPHDLGRVHRGAAADGDDDIRLEGVHALQSLAGGAEGRVRENVGEDFGLDAHVFKNLQSVVEQAVLIEELVGDEEGALLVAEVAQTFSQAAVFEVDFRRDTEPQHVFSPLCNGFDVQKMFRRDVLADGVAAPGSATEGEGGVEFEVEDIADSTLAGGHVDQHAAGCHAVAKVGNAVGVARVRVEHACVTHAAELDQSFRVLNRRFKVFDLVESENRREFFAGERIVGTDAVGFRDQDFCILGNLDACHRGDLECALADDFGVELVIDDDGFADFVRLFFGENVGAAFEELGFDFVIDAFDNSDRLLGSADHAVIEGFTLENAADSHEDVAGFIEDRGGVSCADADCGNARGVSSFDHARTAGREDQVDHRVTHEVLAEGNGRLIDPADDVCGCAGCNSGVADDFRGFDRGFLRSRMGAEDNAVAGLQCEKGFEDSGGGRVCGRNDTGDQADRFRELHDTESFIVFDHVAGFFGFVLVVDVFGSEVVLDDLVFDHAHSGFGNRHLGKGNTSFVCSDSGRTEDVVDLLLSIRRIFRLRRFDSSDSFVEFLKLLFRFSLSVGFRCNFFCHIFTFCFHWLNKIFHMKVCFSPCCFLKYIISQRNQAPFVIFVENIFFEIFYIVKI